jgi:hypothetical protein
VDFSEVTSNYDYHSRGKDNNDDPSKGSNDIDNPDPPRALVNKEEALKCKRTTTQ